MARAAALLATVATVLCAPDAPGTTVFSYNEGHWPCTRIPSIILAGHSTLLAFAECRDRTGDGCKPDRPVKPTLPACVCMKRSETNGSTWDSTPRCVAPPGSTQPLAAYHSGSGTTILHFNVNGTVHQTRSIDDGRSWGRPRSLASDLTPLCAASHAGPGRGLMLSRGEMDGRLVMVGWDKAFPASDRHDCIWYSDDAGETWTISKTTIPLMNEAQVAEVVLPEGGRAVYFNSRTRGNIPGKPSECRASSLSRDYGAHFMLPVQWNPVLTEPGAGCQGSVIGLPIGNPKYLFFSNPAGVNRTEMTVRRSEDAGAAWPLSRVVHPGGSAYSCLTELPDPDKFGLLHERDSAGCRGPSCEIVFNVLSLDLDVLR